MMKGCQTWTTLARDNRTTTSFLALCRTIMLADAVRASYEELGLLGRGCALQKGARNALAARAAYLAPPTPDHCCVASACVLSWQRVR